MHPDGARGPNGEVEGGAPTRGRVDDVDPSEPPEQQRLADLYHQAGAIPDKLNVRAQFDPRFNSVVAKAQS